MLDKEVIEPSISPWSSPIVLVKKKDGIIRFCVDFRLMNRSTLTAFSTLRGLFQFRVMPFGWTSASSTFERFMETALAGLQWKTCLIYLDDVILYSCSVPKMTTRLREVFGRLDSAGLKLKPSKCALYQMPVQFLGHVVSEEGVATDPAKIQAVANCPMPTNLKDLLLFLGLCG